MGSSATCPDPRDLRALLDGSPTEAEQATLTAHLNGCARCREALEGLTSDRETWEGVARRLREEAPPAPTLLTIAIDPAGEGARIAPAATELPPEFLGPL